MILIAGLGNPGEKYKRTRHNLGFMVLDELQKIQGFSDWQIKKKFKAEISEGIIDDKKIILTKPQTFMNDSGLAVKKLTINYKLPTTNLFVAHDDLDIEIGEIKISQNRGSAGHKGVQSIIEQLGTKDFTRFRIGIKNTELRIQNAEDFVLKNFTKEENQIIKEAIKKTCEQIKAKIKL